MYFVFEYGEFVIDIVSRNIADQTTKRSLCGFILA